MGNNEVEQRTAAVERGGYRVQVFDEDGALCAPIGSPQAAPFTGEPEVNGTVQLGKPVGNGAYRSDMFVGKLE